MNKIRLLTFSIASLLMLFPNPAFAGGSMMATYADTEGSTNNDGLYLRVIRAFLHPEFPCKGAQITFRFADPKDGDYSTTGSGTSTYIMQEDRTSNGCSTYAKMGSKIPGVRKVVVDLTNTNQIGGTVGQTNTITVDFDGKYHADNSYNGYNYRSSTDDPYFFMTSNPVTPTPATLPEGKINVSVLSQQFVAPYGRQVLIKFGWATTDGNISYNIYTRRANDKDWEKQASGLRGPSTTLNLRADKNYYIKAQGCIDKIGNCVDSSELFLVKLKEQQTKEDPTPNDSITEVTPNPSITTGVTSNKKVDELNNKVADLEKKLEESKQRQSFLEQRVTDLANFIKRLFPFFK